MKLSLNDLLSKKIVIFLLVIPFFEPFGTEEIIQYTDGAWVNLHILFVVLKWISFLILFLICIQQIRSISSFVIILIIFQAWIIIVTVMNRKMTFGELSTIVCTIAAALLFDYYLQSEMIYDLLNIVEKILFFGIIINSITILLFPRGMYVNNRGWWQNWIFGYKNLHVYYYIPYLSISALCQYLDKGRLHLRYYMMSIIICIFSLMSGSLTSFVATSIFFVLSVIVGDHNLPKIINYITIYVVSIITSYLVIIYGIQYRYEKIVKGILGKDTSISSRTIIWGRALKDYFKHPLLGNGLLSYDNLFPNWVVTQMHNMYLDIVVTGGIVLLILFSIIIIIENRYICMCSCRQLKNIFLVAFASYSVLFITEARRDMILLYIFLIIAYYLPKICEKYSLPEGAKKYFRFVWRSKK